jgi:hypothetical protein
MSTEAATVHLPNLDARSTGTVSHDPFGAIRQVDREGEGQRPQPLTSSASQACGGAIANVRRAGYRFGSRHRRQRT